MNTNEHPDDIGNCEWITTDWSRCIRPAAREVTVTTWSGEAKVAHYCTQHANTYEKRVAKAAQKESGR